MSMTDPARGTSDPGRAAATTTGSTEVRGRATESFARRRRDLRETKPSFMTTEFWMTIAGVVGTLLIVGALACLIPARRAARTNAVMALRSE